MRPRDLDAATFPVSSRGSWLSLAVRDGRHGERHRPLGDGLYLRNHHGRQLNSRELARLTLLRGRRPARARVEIGTGWLRLRPERGAGAVEILLLAPEGLRIRCAGGLGVKLEARTGYGNLAYQLEPGRQILNLRGARMRFMVETLAGAAELDAPWEEASCRHLVIRLLPGPGGAGEWALDGYRSTWLPPARRPFDKERARLEADFAAYLTAQPDTGRAEAGLRREAALTNWSCIVSPCGQFRREAMLMSKGWMDQVWSWDHLFNALPLAAGMPELAMDQLLTIIDRQDEHGCYPDACNDVHAHYCFNKPPVWGLLVDCLRGQNPGWFTWKRLAPVVESVERFSWWWWEHRRLPGRPLCYYLHGNDSGWDNSTQFDAGVPLEAADLNAFLVTQFDFLAAAWNALGKKKRAGRCRAMADLLATSLVSELWDGDHFAGLKDGARVENASLIPLMPLVLGPRLDGPIRARLVRQLRGHLTRWGLATEHPASPRYTADGYWRGPIWGPSTVLACLGLERCGEHALAATVVRRFRRLCRHSGFAENFDALTGAPLRDPSYSWTASAYLFLASRARDQTTDCTDSTDRVCRTNANP